MYNTNDCRLYSTTSRSVDLQCTLYCKSTDLDVVVNNNTQSINIKMNVIIDYSYTKELSQLNTNLREILLKKLQSNCFDAGEYFIFGENDEENLSNSIESPESSLFSIDLKTSLNLYAKQNIEAYSTVILIDHMWLTTFPQSRQQILEYEGLRHRIIEFFSIEEPELTENNVVNYIWNKIWPFLNSFKLSKETYTQWYLMDEVGLSISHSVEPNMKTCTIQYEELTYTIAWPIKTITEGDLITRNFFHDFADISISSNALSRDLMSLAYKFQSDINVADNMNLYLKHLLDLRSNITDEYKYEPRLDLQSVISFPSKWKSIYDKLEQIKLDSSRKLKVYCDRSDHINASYLEQSEKIEIVSNAEEADALYLIDHTLDDGESEINKEGKITSQFCWNGLIITKDELIRTMKLARLIRNQSSSEVDASSPYTLPTSFDLTSTPDLIDFLLLYFTNFDKNDNIWILKEHSGKQSLDYPISSNLSCLIKHCQVTSRLASQYILHPLLLEGKKFDLRYHVLVHSIDPEVILSRHEVFVVRWANKEYTSDSFEEYQQHFTVMSFLDDKDDLHHIRGIGKRRNLKVDEFIKLIDSDMQSNGKSITWMDNIQPNIDKLLREVFESTRLVFRNHVLNRIDHPAIPNLKSSENTEFLHPNSNWSLKDANISPVLSLFGVDVIIDKSLQPKLLEVQASCFQSYLLYIIDCLTYYALITTVGS